MADTDTCPACGAPVLTGHKAGQPVHLEPEPGHLGIWVRDPDTGLIRTRHIREMVAAIENGNRRPGHHVHQCAPAPAPAGDTLF